MPHVVVAPSPLSHEVTILQKTSPPASDRRASRWSDSPSYDDVMDLSETCAEEVFRDMQWLTHRALVKDRPNISDLRQLLTAARVGREFLNSCLWLATTYDREEYVQLYLDMGADAGVLLGGVWGLRPREVLAHEGFCEAGTLSLLRKAVLRSQYRTAARLLSAGAALAEDPSSYIYLMRACVQRRDKEILALLVQHGDMFTCCPISMLDPYRYTVLGQAVFQDDVETIRFLLKVSEERRRQQLAEESVLYNSAAIAEMAAYRARQEATALANAVIFGYHRSAAVLLQSKNHRRCPPDTLTRRLLCSAVQSKQRKVVGILLQYHPDLIWTSHCRHGPSPLHCAAWHNSRAAGSLLLAAGASNRERNADGFLPHVTAIRRGHKQLGQMIKSTKLTLQQRCMVVVRKSVNVLPLGKSVEQLPLPKSIKENLVFA